MRGMTISFCRSHIFPRCETKEIEILSGTMSEVNVMQSFGGKAVYATI